MQAELETRHLLLVGGGHSHLFVVKHFARRQNRRLRITLLSKTAEAWYSGMIPGVIAGHYPPQQTKIDLRRLCAQGGIDFIEDEFDALDPDQQRAYCKSREPIHYDWISLNLGSEPNLSAICGAEQTGIAAKPIEQLLKHWHNLPKYLARQPNPHLCVVGGGAASIEIALAIRFALKSVSPPLNPQITLICASSTPLPSHHQRVQQRIARQLEKQQIELLCGHTVQAASGAPGNYTLMINNAGPLHCNEVIWAVQAAAPGQLTASTGLNCTSEGFIRVNQYLQSLSHKTVFACGDVAHFEPHPLAKSGVYAVRQGPLLAENLQRTVAGQALKTFKPQPHFLSLLALGEKQALASRGSFCLSGGWVWYWKDAIDRRFIRQFQAFKR